MVEPENHTLALLREMRAFIEAQQREMRADMDRRHAELTAELAAIRKRLDAMHLNGTKALKGFIGHRAMVEWTMASFETDMSDVKRRVTALEDARS